MCWGKFKTASVGRAVICLHPRPQSPHGGRQHGCRGAGVGWGAPLGQGCGAAARARGCQVWAWVFRISWGQVGGMLDCPGVRMVSPELLLPQRPDSCPSSQPQTAGCGAQGCWPFPVPGSHCPHTRGAQGSREARPKRLSAGLTLES